MKPHIVHKSHVYIECMNNSIAPFFYSHFFFLYTLAFFMKILFVSLKRNKNERKEWKIVKLEVSCVKNGFE